MIDAVTALTLARQTVQIVRGEAGVILLSLQEELHPETIIFMFVKAATSLVVYVLICLHVQNCSVKGLVEVMTTD
jgi:hypothetical protein